MYPGARPCTVMPCSVIKIISNSIVKQMKESNGEVLFCLLWTFLEFNHGWNIITTVNYADFILHEAAALLFTLPLSDKRLSHWLSCWFEITLRGSMDFQQHRGHETQSVLFYNYRLRSHYGITFGFHPLWLHRTLNLLYLASDGESQKQGCGKWITDTF